MDARRILDRALAASGAEHLEATLDACRRGSTRFSSNAITQNVADEDARLCVRSAFGLKVGTAETNDLSDEGIARAVARSEALARSSAEDLESLPPLPPQAYPDAEAWDAPTAAAGPAERASWIEDALRAAPRGVTLSGSTATEDRLSAFASSAGAFASHRSTHARFTVTGVAPDSTGWAEGQSSRAAGLDPAALARRAGEKALASASPKDLEPGSYPVILEPAAVAEYLSFLLWSLDAKAADEGRSCLSGKLGAALASPCVTMGSDPARKGAETAPFLDDGMPAPRGPWIERGVLKRLETSRFWGLKTGRAPTGGATNLVVEGGGSDLDRMIRESERAVLVTRFWYIRFVDPMSLLLTGMTRDGLFLVENGRIRHGLRNLRFNDSPLRTLKHVEALGEPALTGEYFPALVPPMKAGRFTFSSGTTF